VSIFIEVDTPAVNGLVTALPATLCQGESSTLSVSGHYGFLQWQSSSDPAGPFEDIIGATDDTYIFDTDLTTESTYFRVRIYTCTDEYTVPVLVDVFDTPQANFNTDNICADASYVFQNTTVFTSPITTWLWDFDNGQTSNLENPNFFFNPGTYSVSLLASNSAGCSDEITQEIIVYPIPVSGFQVASVCDGLSSQFINTTTIAAPSNIVAYDWNFGLASYATENVTHTYPSEGIYTVGLTVTTNHGCTNTFATQASVFPNPIANFSPNAVCLNVPSMFSDESTVSNNFTVNNLVDWVWNFGEGNTSNMQNPTHTYDVPNTFNVSLTVTTNNGCTDDVTIPVVVYPIPVASFVGTNREGCSPIFPVLTSTSTVGAPSQIVNYNWVLSNGSSQDSSLNQYFGSFSNNGSASNFYDVQLTVTTNHGCVHTLIEEDFIQVYHNPIADFYYEPFFPTILEPDVQFFNTSQFADYYNWTFLGLGTSNETNPYVVFPDEEPETYRVTLIASTEEGCADTTFAIVTVQDIILFYVPNTFTPDIDDFNEVFKPIFTSGFDPLSYHLTIFNRWGQIVFESYDSEVGWDGTYGVGGTRDVQEGTYIWQISFLETMSDKRHLYRGHINLLK
jgi:gliding motility-associated-like protein